MAGTHTHTHTHTHQIKIKNVMSPRILSFKIFFSKVKKKKHISNRSKLAEFTSNKPMLK